MILPFPHRPALTNMGQVIQDREEKPMKWETPEAIEFRFGMEITMYIANR